MIVSQILSLWGTEFPLDNGRRAAITLQAGKEVVRYMFSCGSFLRQQASLNRQRHFRWRENKPYGALSRGPGSPRRRGRGSGWRWVRRWRWRRIRIPPLQDSAPPVGSRVAANAVFPRNGAALKRPAAAVAKI